jgi:dihydrofolate reductase
MGVSLDGFTAGRGGELEWSAPGEELLSFHNEQVRELGVQVCGRGLYEDMLPWEHPDQRPPSSELEAEFARMWTELPKLVFSSTLERVEGNATLARGGLAEEIARLKEQSGKDIAVGGARLAGAVRA